MTPNPHQDFVDTPMTGTYIAAIVIEAVIIALLWILGRVYA